MDERPKIEIVRVSSTERRNFRPLDGVQLRAAYSHVRIGTYCPGIESELETSTMSENKPPHGGHQTRKFKKNLGPVSRLLRRRHHGTCLATKSCDNIYNVNKNSSSLDWRIMGQSTIESGGLQARQSNSLDWREGRKVNTHWRDSSRSAEQLSRNNNFTSGGLHTPSAKSKIVSLLRRLSPRLPRPGGKTIGGSMTSSPSVCPWIRVEYSNESVNNDQRKEESQESDVSYQRELQLNELRKKMLGNAIASPSSSPLASSYSYESQLRIVDPTNSATRDADESGTTESSRNAGNCEEETADNSQICRAVHEDRTGKEETLVTFEDEDKTSRLENRRRRPRRGPGHGEVAGLEENDNIIESTVVLISGTAGNRQKRLTRPHSLAVQSLNYQRIDPETSLTDEEQEITRNSGVRQQHPNMTSQESIGNCSLDVDRSASDRSETTVGSISEKTLHSLNLSCNGQAQSPQEIFLHNGSNDTLQKQQEQQQERPVVQIDCINGEKSNDEPEQLTAAKKPSYLGLACSISGYSGITRYDSKLREGFRSRDSSPGSRLITRETSPAGFRSNENLGVPGINYPTKSQSISPLAMDRQNGFSNGAKEYKIENFVETRSTINSCQGYSEVDKGLPLHTNFADISPIRATSPIKRTTGLMQITSCSRETKSYASTISVSSPRSGNIMSNNSFSDTSFVNGSSIETIENQTLNKSSCSEKSFIQQRVERLYGPGALAQGFFFKRSSGNNLNTSETSFNKSNSNNNDTSADNANTEESLKNLPVLRHLRPEFRAQLPVVSPRKPTDGSEQLIKPLQRISVTPVRKNESKVKTQGSSTNPSCNVRENETALKLSASVTSIPDQQPAAPEVVLPVLESSVSSVNIATTEKTTRPEESCIEEKHGHHFMRLLNAERDRLLVLAESAEAELANADPATMPEEAEGKLRSAAGKARLLAKQKMQQFEGLCHKNISQVPGEKFPTTYEDLAGFWDMVMLQVVQVNDIFAQIEKLKSSKWQEIIPDKKPSGQSSQNGNATKRRLIVTQRPKITATSEANRKAREAREQARRQMIEDRRRAMRSNVQKEDDNVTIFAPET